MDPQSAREVGPLLVELRDIRNTLRRSLQAAQNLDAKFSGPRPASPESINKAPSDSVRSLTVEMLNLSAQLEKWMELQHSLIGDPEGGNAPPRAVGY